MGRGRAIAILASAFGSDQGQLAAFADILTRLAGLELTPRQLSGIVPEGREYLIFRELLAAGAIVRGTETGIETRGEFIRTVWPG
jgi:hypothetical protein